MLPFPRSRDDRRVARREHPPTTGCTTGSPASRRSSSIRARRRRSRSRTRTWFSRQVVPGIAPEEDSCPGPLRRRAPARDAGARGGMARGSWWGKGVALGGRHLRRDLVLADADAPTSVNSATDRIVILPSEGLAGRFPEPVHRPTPEWGFARACASRELIGSPLRLIASARLARTVPRCDAPSTRLPNVRAVPRGTGDALAPAFARPPRTRRGPALRFRHPSRVPLSRSHPCPVL